MHWGVLQKGNPSPSIRLSCLNLAPSDVGTGRTKQSTGIRPDSLDQEQNVPMFVVFSEGNDQSEFVISLH